MANSFTSAATAKVADAIMDEFEGNAVLIKEVNTQLLNEEGISQPEYGGSISFQRPMQRRTVETADGDVSGETPNDITYGKSTGTVQNVVTIELNWNAVDEAIKARQLKKHLEGLGQYMIATVEKNFGSYMINNSGLTMGTVGTFVDSWDDVMATKAFFRSLGVKGEIKYIVNDYSMGKLASLQQGVANMPSTNVRSAWEDAQIPSRVAGVSVMSSDMLSNYTAGATADRAGSLAATPTATYASVKDTMTQSLSLTGLTINTTNAVRAGDVLEFT
ncbi:MAG TPA: P22 phage major capsid protein family protein, partial [Cellvibrio sp.]